MDVIRIGWPLELLEDIPSGLAQMVFLDVLYETGSMGALAFTHATKGVGEHLEEVSKLLQQSWRVLADEGTIFIQGDPFIAPYHRLLADRIFGADSFATDIVLPSDFPPRPDMVWPNHSVISVYARPDASFVRVPTTSRSADEISAQYRHSDERGPFRLVDLTRPARESGSHLSEEWNGIALPRGRQWRFSREVLDQLAAEARIVVAEDRRRAFLKAYLSETPPVPVGSIWTDARRSVLEEKEQWPEEHAAAAFARLPLLVADRMIAMGTTAGGLVVAPADVSGSVATAAARSGRRWITSVNHPFFANAVSDRLERHGFKAGDLFHVVDPREPGEIAEPHRREYQDFVSGLVPNTAPLFVLGTPVPFEESLHLEFKQVEGSNPVNTIKETADRYAVGFLNREGGRVLWGIRNKTRTTEGVALDSQARDNVRIAIVDKLKQLDPAPTPNQYRIHFHPVRDAKSIVPDLWVVELDVSRGNPQELYATAGGKHFMKTDSGVTLLSGRTLVDEVRRRLTA